MDRYHEGILEAAGETAKALKPGPVPGSGCYTDLFEWMNRLSPLGGRRDDIIESLRRR